MQFTETKLLYPNVGWVFRTNGVMSKASTRQSGGATAARATMKNSANDPAV